MQLKDIKRGHWYETKQGTGEAVTVGGTRPPSVRMRITHPIPRGEVMVSPRDVIREAGKPAALKPEGD